MNRMRFESSGNVLRNQILEVLRTSRTSSNEDLVALLQCAAQIKNATIVDQAAKECGLRLSDIKTDDTLELYYDLKRDRDDVGYISKGWDDPGFRVGDIVTVPPANKPAFQDNLYTFLRFCAVNGVASTFEENGEAVEIHMDSVIYSEGFNKEVLRQTLHYLNLCVEKAHTLFGLS